MPVPYIPTDTRVLSTANGAVVGQLQNQIMDIGRPDSRYSNRSRDRRSRSRSRYELITCFHEFWIYESAIFFSLTSVFGCSLIWTWWILKFNICFIFFHSASLQKTTTNICYSKFDMTKWMSCQRHKRWNFQIEVKTDKKSLNHQLFHQNKTLKPLKEKTKKFLSKFFVKTIRETMWWTRYRHRSRSKHRRHTAGVQSSSSGQSGSTQFSTSNSTGRLVTNGHPRLL